MKTARWLSGIGWLLGLMIMTGCGSAENDASNPLFHRISLDQALSKAKADKKLVMIDFYADWCGPCQMLDDTTWKDSKVRSWLREKAVAIKVDVDKEKSITNKYNVNSFPTLMFLKPDGSEIGRLVGFHSPEEFLEEA